MIQSALAFQPSPSSSSICRSPNSGPTTSRAALHTRFAERIIVNYELSRRLVSYQGNKAAPGFRWMRYKEGFSAQLVERLLSGSGPGAVLDPFSGIGTTALTASRTGRRATGVEIMPVGNLMARAITATANGLDQRRLANASKDLLGALANGSPDPKHAFPHVRITQCAFSPQAEADIAKARQFIAATADNELATVLEAACVAAIEEVSYTRKDGQYLRWDPRSGRTASTRLDKGQLPTLTEVLKRRLNQMIEDVPAVKRKYAGPPPELINGSCLTKLQDLEAGTFDTVVTSPPYANRYDYTRTYALELAFLGHDEAGFKTLRQALLSATVENRSKRDELRVAYAHSNQLSCLFAMVDENAALNEVLNILREHIEELGNRNVIRLLEHYFTEMAVVISELARLVAPGGQVFMVNDNVRYHGEETPVDLILSDFAEQLGFCCKTIWALPRGKGNSSQQMGRFGRQEIRKCVYHWVRV
ncbi:MAG: site-specific DNA-methyltransferase [Gammaproteobacteria bacterium]|nr:site-specific DNA-methyltransferase [Gammaproteobacteria bacterium]